MGTTSPKNEKEKLFDELITVKILHKNKESALKKMGPEATDYNMLKAELTDLKKKIKTIGDAISKYGDSFWDVYDAELIKPLSESDIITLRDEISEIKDSLEAMDK
mgnify:CR=1 FL=1